MDREEVTWMAATARHGSSVGQPLTRRDGPSKVTGAAIYAADASAPAALHGVVVPSTIASGRVRSLDVAAALAVAGVVKVLSPLDPPTLAADPMNKLDGHTFRVHLLQALDVTYANQAVAFVAAETIEAARDGATALAPRYDEAPALSGLDAREGFTPEVVGPGFPATVETGEVAAALVSSAHVIEAIYETQPQYHNAMEPHAILAERRGEALHLTLPSQAISLMRGRVAGLLGMLPENVHIHSEFVGGGFGSKAFLTAGQILAIIAARETGRPVKFAYARDQLFGPAGHRAATRQSFRIGVRADGRLTAIVHHTRTTSSMFDDFFEPAGTASRSIYAVGALRNSHGAVRVNSGTPMFMRGPGEASGSIAFESAMDEAALACGVDPLEFRVINYAETDPLSGKPFSSKALRECYRQGAERFGWSRRRPEPRSLTTEAGLLLGHGVGSAHFPALMFAAQARTTLSADGTALVEVGAHDMGQGISTVLPQIAADALDLPVERIALRHGTSDLPSGGMGGGSAHTSTAGSAGLRAGEDVVARLTALATGDEGSPLFGAGNVGVVARDGHLCRRDDEAVRESYVDIMRRAGLSEVVGEGQGGANAAAQAEFAMYAHGAVFAEVHVDPELCQMRVARLAGAFAVGRVINPRLVRSQLVGGMTWACPSRCTRPRRSTTARVG